jgi:hypothetical protein
MKQYNLQNIYANIDNMLFEAQETLEKAIEAYGIANDDYGNKFTEYRKERAVIVRRLKSEGKQVGVIKDMTDGETANLKGELLKAEGRMKKCKMYVDAYTERVQAIKFVGRKTDTLVK